MRTKGHLAGAFESRPETDKELEPPATSIAAAINKSARYSDAIDRVEALAERAKAREGDPLPAAVRRKIATVRLLVDAHWED